MPRIKPGSFWQARALDPLLPRLLPPCRDLRSAQLEFRWLREHANQQRSSVLEANRLLRRYVSRRSRGEPLQYLLGSEFFGELEIKCRPGVLIPRQETAESVTYLVDLLSRSSKSIDGLRVLDLCTGTGCIPLLFHHQYYSNQHNRSSGLDLVGVDLSAKALRLALENHGIQLNEQGDAANPDSKRTQSLQTMKFVQSDVLQGQGETYHAPPSVMEALQSCRDHAVKYDILISNPPYISSKDYFTSTARSVRKYEPKLALVPPCPKPQDVSRTRDGDLFYPRLLDIANEVGAQIILFEVSDLAQAERVVNMAAAKGGWEGQEIWRNNPTDGSVPTTAASNGSAHVTIRGSGDGRSVLLYRGEGAGWLGKQ